MQVDALKNQILEFEVDSTLLKENARNNGAFYLIGYVIELALKICISNYFLSKHYPPDNFKKNHFKIHDYEHLLSFTGLYKEMYSRSNTDLLRQNWNIILQWNPEIRYSNVKKSDNELADIFSAIFDENYGVLQWLKQNW